MEKNIFERSVHFPGLALERALIKRSSVKILFFNGTLLSLSLSFGDAFKPICFFLQQVFVLDFIV